MSSPATIIARVVAWLDTVPALAGRVFELDPSEPIAVATTPTAAVSWSSIDSGETDGARTIGVVVDVAVGPDYWIPTGLSPMAAILGLHELVVQMLLAHRGLDDPAAPGTGSPLYRGNNSSYSGSRIWRIEQGAPGGGFTVQWTYIYEQDGNAW